MAVDRKFLASVGESLETAQNGQEKIRLCDDLSAALHANSPVVISGNVTPRKPALMNAALASSITRTYIADLAAEKKALTAYENGGYKKGDLIVNGVYPNVGPAPPGRGFNPEWYGRTPMTPTTFREQRLMHIISSDYPRQLPAIVKETQLAASSEDPVTRLAAQGVVSTIVTHDPRKAEKFMDIVKTGIADPDPEVQRAATATRDYVAEKRPDLKNITDPSSPIRRQQLRGQLQTLAKG